MLAVEACVMAFGLCLGFSVQLRKNWWCFGLHLCCCCCYELD